MLKLIERYKKFRYIKNEKPYIKIKLLAQENSKKLVSIFTKANLSLTIMSALSFSVFVLINIPENYNVNAYFNTVMASFALSAGISFLIIYTFNYFLFSKLFNKKLRKEYNSEIKKLFGEHSFQEYIHISDLFKRFGNFKKVDRSSEFVLAYGAKDILNLIDIKTIQFLEDEFNKLSDKKLLEKHNHIVSFFNEFKEFKNDKKIFNIIYKRYERMLSEEIINVDTFEKHLLMIMNTLFKDLNLFSDMKYDLNNYIDSYKKINNIQTKTYVKKDKQTVF
tara:strand:- start:814 stop:1647 length:834 start_codon:yes stop_codon:yes gene_type:complete